MADPIKPQNEISLGGVKFNANEAESYGKLPLQDTYYIDFKNGTKVHYPKQTSDAKIDGLGAYNIDGLHVNRKGQNSCLKDYSIFNCDNSVIVDSSRSDKDDLATLSYVSVQDSENCSILLGVENDNIYVKDSKNVNIKSGSGEDNVKLINVENFDIDTGSGKDNVNVNVEVSEYDGEIILGQENVDNMLKTRNVIIEDVNLPEGSVKLDSEDELNIEKEVNNIYHAGDLRDDKTGEVLGFVDNRKTTISTAKVIGEGTHEIKQTPKEAFETKVQEETDFHYYGEY